LPTWEQVTGIRYDPWNEEHIIIDTANKTIEECTKELMEKINTYK
jgi:adenylylsulfate kinase-like enzyme